MQNYKHINCEMHDGYELACMRKAIHEVTWQDDDQSRTEKLRFLDLDYGNKEEHLIAENQAGEKFRIRLDMITSSLPY